MIEEILFILHFANGIHITIHNVIRYKYTYSNTNTSINICILVRIIHNSTNNFDFSKMVIDTGLKISGHTTFLMAYRMVYHLYL